MNKRSHELCDFVLKELLKNPVAHALWNTASDVQNSQLIQPVDLKTISEKLSRNIYTDLHSFMEDINRCINNSTNGFSPSTFRHAAALQLKEELGKLMEKFTFPSVRNEFVNSAKKITNLGSYEGEVRTMNVTKPSAGLFTEENPDIKMLMRCLASPEMLHDFYLFLANLQVESITTGETISVNLTVLTEENRNKLRDYLLTILFNAASGRVNPFNRPFGVKISPVSIREGNDL